MTQSDQQCSTSSSPASHSGLPKPRMRPGLLIAKLRVLVDVAPPLNHFLLHSRSGFSHFRFERGNLLRMSQQRYVFQITSRNFAR
jgi:hypothetical protein